jgi:hypothetical protein
MIEEDIIDGEGRTIRKRGGETKVLQTRDGRDVSHVFSKSSSPSTLSLYTLYLFISLGNP